MKSDFIQEPKVDVVLPNYNNGEFVDEAIRSVVNQSYNNWNLFIIDDNSEDNSKIKINKYKKHNKINIIFLPKNKGVAFCRNLGMRLSTSEYVSFLDADDYWSIDKLKKQIFFMEKFNYKFTYSNYTPFKIKNNTKIFKKQIVSPTSFNYEEFINNTSIGMSSVILKRSIIKTTRFRKFKICEDYYFKCEILRREERALRINENTMFYRISKNSLQSNKLRNFYWVWHINKYYNHLSFIKNFKSLLFIIINSIKKYGFK